jgi:hypothetical protein
MLTHFTRDDRPSAEEAAAMDAESRPSSPRPDPSPPGPPGGAPLSPSRPPQRLFLHEPGWAVALKIGSERVFCYQMAPDQDFYHRLLDGEIYLHHGDEKLCLACAERRGLLSFEPRGLRTPVLTLEVTLGAESPGGSEFEVQTPPDPPLPGEGRPAR